MATGPVDEATIKVIENYTWVLYGARKSVPLNCHRYRVFDKAYRAKDSKKPFQKLKGIDASAIPPCESVISQKIARTSFVTRMWHVTYANSVPKCPTCC